jgi:hypothetical protein
MELKVSILIVLTVFIWVGLIPEKTAQKPPKIEPKPYTKEIILNCQESAKIDSLCAKLEAELKRTKKMYKLTIDKSNIIDSTTFKHFK